MAKKKRKNRKRIAYGSAKKIVEQTPEQMRSKFPKDLVAAFIKVSDADWNEKDYKPYRKLADKFLGDASKDPIDCGRLVVNLARATMDIREKEKNRVQKQKKKTKKVKVKDDAG